MHSKKNFINGAKLCKVCRMVFTHNKGGVCVKCLNRPAKLLREMALEVKKK